MSHNVRILITVCIVLLIFFGCKGGQSNKEVVTLVQEWQGKEIIFPDSLVFTSYTDSAIDYSIPDAKYKVLAYVDSAGCTDCILNLQSWQRFIADVDTISGGAVPFLFFIHPKDGEAEEIYYLLEMYRFKLPVCIDTEDRLNGINHFPANSNFHFFLLDRDNKVAVIGNPIYSREVRELYINIIQQE
jgi:hypothetical protein